MASAITVTYELHPPSDTPAAGLETTKTHTFPVGNALVGKQYYDVLRNAIAEAKNTLGEELTAWRDAVGNREQVQESRLSQNYDEDEDGEDEEADE
ncbi:uncharacterized protein LAESUDRAFT_664581 [Laetiporus sulphureus 93-53]|uniref:EKC/KEOPS complex subunit GON7 n=1 Tax=Laetiporus sulphureus 93-53 TaxID=1314785 RepID=A0A165BJC4_9APHY|nr:uncharacterized protein LAESUDRAFT_664581 [Laetiporus sulphureus 93-53]KZT01168.1 hypothetical protein LAESUDRAFT_664581 [Laetiporus sulphureus 93-53]